VCNSGHRIEAANVIELVRDTLKAIAHFAKTDKDAFKKSVQELLASQQTNEVKKQRKSLAVCQKRSAELERLLNKIYEDNALGRLPENRYQSLHETYGQEQETLEKEIAELQSTVEKYENGSERAKNFIKLVERYTDFTEITVTMLNEFIEKIVVHERDAKGCIDTEQKVDIHLNFIGEFEIPKEAVDPAVLAEQEETNRKKLEKRERQHQKYLQLKAAGKIAEYEQNTKAKRAAGIPPRPMARTPEEKAARDIARREYSIEYGRKRWAKIKAEREAQQAALLQTSIHEVQSQETETPKKKTA
jgi:hypothetical protein